jgi:2'-5' RNA ligase
MQQLTKPFQQTEVELYEYLLLAYPNNCVSEKIMAEKRMFGKAYGEKCVVPSKPHITVANFLAREAMEDTIIRYTQRICSQQQSFEVAVNNYSGVPPHHIHLRIQNPERFKQIAKELVVISNYVTSCSCPPVKLVKNPRVNIADHLPETLYLKAMMDYSQRTFFETFMVSELILLRRNNEYDSCKTVQVFRLQPAPDSLLKNILFN